MKKIDLIEALSKEISITRSEAKHSVEIILEEISLAVISGKGVEIRGFGGFQKRHRKGRIGINPKTGQKTVVDEKFVPFFNEL
jgi:integration host factor subunit beta